MPQDHIHAVLTGDLIRSTRLPPQQADAAISALEHAARRWQGNLHFTRFRGDGWQILLEQPQSALRIALYMTAALAAADTGLTTRLAIGFGTVARLREGDLSGATGTAFTRSGRALDHMPRNTRWAVAGGPTLPAWIPATLALAEWQSARWTAGQAAVVAEWLDPVDRTQEEWASRMGLTRQAWKARFDGSGIAAWTAALQMWDQWQGDGVTDD
ncbi:MAG: hypothetical protein O9247_00440 [Rhodobacteraceae bacterium]|nr:hypothetical protein [Paracoccaceae bacterium]